MKKQLLFIALMFTAVYANAQLMRAEELEKYAKSLYGDKWVDVAENLKNESALTLDKNNSMTFIQVVDAPERTAGQLYTTLNYWFTSTFNNAESTIRLNDKEAGCIIAQGFVEEIAIHSGGSNKYKVSIRPIIKVDIKDGKCRVTYSIQAYNVTKIVGGGVLGKIKKAVINKAEKAVINKSVSGHNEVQYDDQTWPLDQTYPFAIKDAFNAKKTSAKACIMAYSYSQVIMDKIETAIKEGMVGEDSEW